jgi:hypothetical protein
MHFFEDLEIGRRREFGSFTFTAESIKKFAAQFDPQRFHLDEEEGRKSLFGGLAASGWHVGSVCMKLLVADGQRQAKEAKARGDEVAVWAVAGLSRIALDPAGAGGRHHQFHECGRDQAGLGLAPWLGHHASPQHRHQSAGRRGVFVPGDGVRAAAECGLSFAILVTSTSFPGRRWLVNYFTPPQHRIG